MVTFRKRIKVIPGVHINVSKSGISTSVGVNGASVSVGRKGTYLNTGIPGTGIYSRKKLSGGEKDVPTKKVEEIIEDDALKEFSSEEIAVAQNMLDNIKSQIKELIPAGSKCVVLLNTFSDAYLPGILTNTLRKQTYKLVMSLTRSSYVFVGDKDIPKSYLKQIEILKFKDSAPTIYRISVSEGLLPEVKIIPIQTHVEVNLNGYVKTQRILRAIKIFLYVLLGILGLLVLIAIFAPEP